MKPMLFLPAAAALVLLSACGYKGSLYLPKEGDKARFGAVQTALPIYRHAGKTVAPQSAPQQPAPLNHSEP